MGKINPSISQLICEKGSFAIKRCYDNIFRNIFIMESLFKREDIEIMFCYISVTEEKNIYTRHVCYLLNGEIIDPTIFQLYKDKLSDYDIDYIPIKTLSVKDYYALIIKEMNPDLSKAFQRLEYKMMKDLAEKNIFLVG